MIIIGAMGTLKLYSFHFCGKEKNERKREKEKNGLNIIFISKLFSIYLLNVNTRRYLRTFANRKKNIF